MSTYSTILVATDFSHGARAAFRQAVRLAKVFGADLHVMTVVRKADATRLPPGYNDASALDSVLTDKATRRIQQKIEENAPGLTPTVHVRAGKVLDEIVAVSENINADLLVIGATGEGKRRWGTIAGRCVRKGPEKVLLVDPDSHGMFQSIVACVDFGPSLGPVAEAAADFAKADATTATALHCYHMPWTESLYAEESPAEALASDETFRESARAQLAGVCDSVNLEFVVDANTNRGILEFCNEHKADLVVTGTTDRTAVAYWLLGTTAEKIMRDSTCTVLTIKTPHPSEG